MRANKKGGFTVLELLVVIAIMLLLISSVSASVGDARRKARDIVRVIDIKNIQTLLFLYFDEYGWGSSGQDPVHAIQSNHGWDGGIGFPDACIQGNYTEPYDPAEWGYSGNWDTSILDGNNDGNHFLDFLVNSGFTEIVPVDPINDGKMHPTGPTYCGQSNTYVFYAKFEGHGNCPFERGDYYLLGISDLETWDPPQPYDPITETGNNASPSSPGFNCGVDSDEGMQHYHRAFEWFTGVYEN